jgi:hypothetical protein
MDPGRDAEVRNTHMNKTLLTLCFVSFAPDAWAQDEAICSAAKPLDGNRLLRRLSLDLRNRVPTGAEIDAQRGQSGVPAGKIDEYLASPELIQVMRRYHASLLWPNLDQVELVPDTHVLYPFEMTPGDPIYLSFLRAVFVRTAPNGNLYVPCKNEPAQFDPDGNLIVEPVMMGSEIIAYQEGYVMVEPYWAPGTQIKVCGLDALDATTSVVCPGPLERYPFVDPICDQFQTYADFVQAPFRRTDVACNSPLAIFAPGCGCGPNLIYCQTPETYALTRTSLLEQMGRIVDRVIQEGRPYHEVMTDPVVEYNGPISHYLEYQSTLSFDLFGGADETFAVPSIPFTDAAWRPMARTGRHSGVLTTPGYLLRFATLRGRAHRFYNAFECSAFIPNGPLPSPFEPCSQHEDLTKRCGCDACHKTLEPMASHWGRFTEYGYSHLDDVRYPTQGGLQCTPPLQDVMQLFRCFRLYELDPVGEEVPYQGLLNAYVFRTPEERINIDEGPSRLAGASVSSGRFSSCTTRKMWAYFMRRDPTPDEEANVLPDIEASFVASDYDLKTLIRSIVSGPAYGRQP